MLPIVDVTHRGRIGHPLAKLIVGCGYLGRRVARLWQEAGEQVWVLTRSAEKAKSLAAEGVSPIVADIHRIRESDLALFPSGGFSTVLFSVGYDRDSTESIQQVYAGGLNNLLGLPLFNSADAATCRWIYISSTGVYGTAGGDIVDETTPPQPAREGGKASLAAEQVLQAHPQGTNSIVLRLAGIYGPGRIPRAAELLAGKEIDAPAAGWLNLIHVDDAARIILFADARAQVPSLYCVSDGSPVQRADYYRELARLLSAPEPRFATPVPSSPAALRAGSDKRISPAKLFRELNPQLRYPSYREGLAAIINEQV
jgi:nucleoside-diphosphate-sugar epimerase